MTHVLIVDDELSIRETFQVFLEDQGYEVTAAADFFEAQSFLEKHSCDVVVADIILPRVDGLALLQRVREIDEDILVIIVTGEPDVATAAEAVRRGAYNYIAKPITQNTLIQTVGRAAERKRLLDDKRRLEMENRAYRAELENRVAERTAELEQRNQELAALIEMGRDISATLDLSEVLDRAAQRAAQVCGAPHCIILRLQEDGARLAPLLVQAGEDHLDQTQTNDAAGRVKSEPSSISAHQMPQVQRVIREQCPLFFSHISDSLLSKNLSEIPDIESILLVPMVSKERVIGLMALDCVDERFVARDQDCGKLAAEQSDLVMAVAAQAAAAIENAHLFQKERKRASQLAVVNQVARRVASILDLERLLHEIVAAIQRGFDYYTVSLFLMDEAAGELELQAAIGGFDDVENLSYRQAVGVGLLGWTAETGQSVMVNDVSQDEHYIAGFTEGMSINSEMCAPIKLAGTVVGVIDVQDIRLKAFDDTDVLALETLADQVAVAIENARHFEQARRRTVQLETASDVARDAAVILDVDRLIDETVNLISDRFGFYHAGVFLIDEKGERAVLCAASSAGGQRMLDQGHALAVGKIGIVGYVAGTGEPRVALDVGRDAVHFVNPDLPRTHSEMALPLRSRERTIGVLDVQSVRKAAFTQEDVSALQTMADQLAVAIENARLFEEVQRELAERKQAEKELQERATRLELIAHIGQRTTAILELDELLHQTVALIGNTFGYYNVNIFLVEGDEIMLEASTFAAQLEGIRLQVGSEGITGWVAGSGEPLLAPDVSQDSRYVAIQEVETRSELAVPIKLKQAVIGVLDAQSVELHAFSQNDIFTLQTVADQLAVAIENAQLFEEINRRLRETRLLQEIMQAAASTLDFDEVLVRVIQTLHETLNFDYLTFAFLNEQETGLVIHPSFVGYPTSIADTHLDLEESVVGQVYQSGEPKIVDDVRESPYYFSGASEVRSELAVPVCVADRIVAVLSAESVRLGDFDEDDLHLLSAVAAQLGVVLENARLFEETEHHLTESRLINEVMLAAASTLKFDLVLERIVKALNRALGLDRLGFLLPDETKGVLKPHPSLVGFTEAAFQVPIKGSLVGKVYQSGQPVLIRNGITQQAYLAGQAPDSRSIMAVPVRVGERIVAVLHADATQAGAFDEGTMILFTTIAGQLGVMLENARLYRELQEINRLRTELVQNVSHELRTPLGLIKGYVELLLSGNLGDILDGQRQALKIIRERTAVLSRLVHNLTILQALPPEILDLDPVSIVEIVRNVLASYLDAAQDAGVKLQEELPSELPLVLCDCERMELAFGHLVDNGIKFSPDGGTITLRAWSDQDMVYVSIADEGIGISAEQQEHLFERFYQADGSASRRFGGMGVGLALACEIVEAHGGTIGVESERGEGSVFTIVLPRAAEML